jgi:hypothetical protein
MRARLVLVPIALTAVFLGGCATSTPGTSATSSPPGPTDNGISALTPEEILTRAQTALGAASSYRMKGEVTEDGQTAKVDLQNGGENIKGTIEFGGQTIELLKIGTDLYMKASDDFWKQFIPAGQQGVLTLLSGKYVKVDSTNASFSSITESFDASEILKIDGTVTKGSPKDINGKPAIGLVSGKDQSTLYIATVGEPLPLRIEGPAGQGAIDFTDYGTTFDFTAPPTAEVFDLKALMGG